MAGLTSLVAFRVVFVMLLVKQFVGRLCDCVGSYVLSATFVWKLILKLQFCSQHELVITFEACFCEINFESYLHEVCESFQ